MELSLIVSQNHENHGAGRTNLCVANSRGIEGLHLQPALARVADRSHRRFHCTDMGGESHGSVHHVRNIAVPRIVLKYRRPGNEGAAGRDQQSKGRTILAQSYTRSPDLALEGVC